MSILKFEKKFNESGLTFTNQRRAIAEVLLNSKNHPDIDQIFLKVKEIDKTASIATIYRNINLFTGLGLVVKRDFEDGKSRYEYKTEKDHNHIIIDGGEIIEFTSKEIESIIQEIVSKKNLTLKKYSIEIYCKKP